MELLEYFDLDTSRVRKQYERVRDCLSARRFAELDTRKLANADIFRVKLDDTNRLLFSFAKFGQATYLLVLEVILNHAYEKSKFLRGKELREEDFVKVEISDATTSAAAAPLKFVNTRSRSFHLLDKPVSFDDTQEEIFHENPPLLIVGAAGCGKTAIAVEKMRLFPGRTLYVSLSPYLVDATRSLFHSDKLFTDEQEIDFLSLREFLESISIPEGREVTFRSFAAWIAGQVGVKARDGRKLFEEFRGVLTGAATAGESLTLEEYLALGVRESIVPLAEREGVYRIFTRYREFLASSQQYDLSMVCSRYIERIAPEYDYLVVDEVQDFTLAQMRAVLASLKTPSSFMLCGDAHQIVHPNLFSWAKLKSFLYRSHEGLSIPDTIRILQANFRNSEAVTALANRLLMVKQRRFGSVDKESNYLVTSQSNQPGEVVLVRADDALMAEIAEKVKLSTRYAVIVLSDDQKGMARERFKTPLVFSVHEAKGLEYENAILFGFMQGASREYREISGDLTPQDLEGDLEFSRAKDKSDKSLDIYKFYTNALYVALTRAMNTVLIVDAEPEHPLFRLMGLQPATSLTLQESSSSREEWQREARRLDMQGKTEQADEIRRTVLTVQPVPWRVTSFDDLMASVVKGGGDGASKKDHLAVLENAVLFSVPKLLNSLAFDGYGFARKPPSEILQYLFDKLMFDISDRISPPVARRIAAHGIDHLSPFGDTLLISAVRRFLPGLCATLLNQGADPAAAGVSGFTPLRTLLSTAMFLQELSNKQREQAGKVFNLIAPPALRVRIGSKLVKIDRSKAEYILVECFLVLMVANSAAARPSMLSVLGARAAELVAVYEALPDEVVARYRKRSAYVSSVLARNEISNNSPYNRRLFYRVSRGCYIPSPLLDVEVKGEWVPWWEAIKMEEFARVMAAHPRYQFPTTRTLPEEFIAWLRERRDELLEAERSQSPEAPRAVTK